MDSPAGLVTALFHYFNVRDISFDCLTGSGEAIAGLVDADALVIVPGRSATAANPPTSSKAVAL
jgi:hypothetical protein